MKGKIIELTNSLYEEKQELGIYLHIPFCIKKCDYCDFLSAPATDEVINMYFDAMMTEIDSYSGNTGNYVVKTVFFGGGTPSCVKPHYIKKLMEAISRVFTIDRKQLEATIEINPGTISEEKLLIYREAGINRLSFGLQSADNKDLSILGRIHTYEQFIENYQLARSLGFDNINIDLMSALPGQTVSAWESTLNKVIALKPEHISAYSLIIEEGTKFYDRYYKEAKGYEELPEEETDRLIYHKTKEILERFGYYRYEISNYALKRHGNEGTYECRHNCSYWIGTDYLGIGLGASSLINGARFSNMDDIIQYIDRCNQYKGNRSKTNTEQNNYMLMKPMNRDLIGIRLNYECLTKEQKMEEFMILGLRMCAGVSKRMFSQRFGIELEDVFSTVLEQLQKKQLIEIQDDRIHLSDFGIDVSNTVLADFLLN